MKIAELNFKTEEGKEPRFCSFSHIASNEWDSSQYKLVKEIAESSATTEEFIDSYLADSRTRMTQLYAELLRTERPDRLWYAIREMFGDEQFKTVSDVGSVLVGNEHFSILIPNGRGDGITRVGVLPPEEFNYMLMKFCTTVSGEFGIYAYDCDDPARVKPLRLCCGRYHVYNHDGFVAFVSAS